MSPEISIIIPVRNDADALKTILRSLTAQKNITFEVIVVDGESTDSPVNVVAELTPSVRFSVRVVAAPAGRGRQMNAGAAAAVARHLLFLHADSFFPSPLALRTALDTLRASSTCSPDRAAGRFRLVFGDTPPGHRGYYYYESKARLGRRFGIHGDQGFLVPRPLYDELCGFDEDLPILEDTAFAEKVRSRGEWRLVPADIVTSARRFEKEGLRERQSLNAIILNFGAIGYGEPLEKMRSLYRLQDETGRLDLKRIVVDILALMNALSETEQADIWRKTGMFVRDNAWQLAFALDTRRAFSAGLPPGGEPGFWLRSFDRRLAPLLDNDAAAAAATVLVRLWIRRLAK